MARTLRPVRSASRLSFRKSVVQLPESLALPTFWLIVTLQPLRVSFAVQTMGKVESKKNSLSSILPVGFPSVPSQVLLVALMAPRVARVPSFFKMLT